MFNTALAYKVALFIGKLASQHLQVEDFDPATNCARVTVVETGMPGNQVCVDGSPAVSREEQEAVAFMRRVRSDVEFDAGTETQETPDGDAPAIARKGGL